MSDEPCPACNWDAEITCEICEQCPTHCHCETRKETTMVTCKFVCTVKDEKTSSVGLTLVSVDNPDEEQGPTVPSGQVTLLGVGQSTFDQFEVDAEYNADFTPAE